MREIALHIICEGDSEVVFAEGLLQKHLDDIYHPQDTCLRVDATNMHGHISWDRFVDHFRRVRRTADLRGQEAYFTTMIDFYGSLKDFPDYERQSGSDHKSVVARIESGMSRELADDRFIPYIQLHEFEALIFCDVELLAKQYFLGEKTKKELCKVLKRYHNQPEEINDGPTTAPSKRLGRIFRDSGDDYRKVIVAGEMPRLIGLPKLREMCPHFNEWVTKLEGL